MNIIIALALAIFLAGGFYRQTRAVSPPPPVPTSTPTLIPSPTTHYPLPTTNPSPTSKPPTPPVTVTVTITSDWQYPGSTRVSSNSYESSDSPDKITDWYEGKIRQIGLNIKTFVRTKTNNRVLNKLVGAGNQTEVQVEISQNPGDSITRIIVGIDN